MRTSHPMFLRRHGKRGHEKVLVHVDWDGVSEADIRQLAAYYVLNRAAHDLKGFDEKLPDSVEYRAGDFIHNEPLTQQDWVIPDSQRGIRKSKARKELEELLKGLGPEEVKLLLSQ